MSAKSHTTAIKQLVVSVKYNAQNLLKKIRVKEKERERKEKNLSVTHYE